MDASPYKSVFRSKLRTPTQNHIMSNNETTKTHRTPRMLPSDKQALRRLRTEYLSRSHKLGCGWRASRRVAEKITELEHTVISSYKEVARARETSARDLVRAAAQTSDTDECDMTKKTIETTACPTFITIPGCGCWTNAVHRVSTVSVDDGEVMISAEFSSARATGVPRDSDLCGPSCLLGFLSGAELSITRSPGYDMRGSSPISIRQLHRSMKPLIYGIRQWLVVEHEVGIPIDDWDTVFAQAHAKDLMLFYAVEKVIHKSISKSTEEFELFLRSEDKSASDDDD